MIRDPDKTPEESKEVELDQLGDYEIKQVLGSGGMGTVYLARHTLLDNLVALKVLNKSPMQNLEKNRLLRFQREARLLSKLKHNNISDILNFGISNDSHPYLVMEYIEGRTLEEEISEFGPFSLTDFLDCFIQATQALEYVHGQGVVHRDVKPGNLLISRANDKRMKVSLVDFGLALSIKDDKQALTGSGTITGSPMYLSPEQSEGTNSTPLSDQYSLGCVMHFALTGKSPYSADSLLELIEKHRRESLDQSSYIDSDPEHSILAGIIAKMTAKRAEDRFGNIADVTSALSDLYEEVVLVESAKQKPVIEKNEQITAGKSSILLKRREIRILIGVIVFICLVVIGFFLFNFNFLSSSENLESLSRNRNDDVSMMNLVNDKNAYQLIDFMVDRKDAPDTYTFNGPKSDNDFVVNYLKSKTLRPKLVFLSSSVTEEGLAQIGRPEIKSLELKLSSVERLDFLDCFPDLESLTLFTTSIPLEEFSKLSRYQNLKSLKLSAHSNLNDDFEPLAEMPGIHTLHLTNTKVKNAGFLKKFPNIKELRLDHTLLDDSGVENIIGLNQLEILFLSGSHVTSVGFAKLAIMKSLQQVVVQDLDIDKSLLLDFFIRNRNSEIPIRPLQQEGLLGYLCQARELKLKEEWQNEKTMLMLAEKLQEKRGQDLLLRYIRLELAEAFLRLQDERNCMSYLDKARRLPTDENEDGKEAMIRFILARRMSGNDIQSCLKNAAEAIKIRKRIGNNFRAAQVERACGFWLLSHSDKIEEARAYFNNSLVNLASKKKAPDYEFGLSTGGLAIIKKRTNERKEALELFEKAIRLCRNRPPGEKERQYALIEAEYADILDKK